MKFCLTCQKPFTSTDWQCTACGDAPTERGGFMAFAQKLASRTIS
ncbi:MAG: hypothetical protein Q7T38_07900 [Gallionella sp.]|nr:hypothetical protein [Gallionella sp.]